MVCIYCGSKDKTAVVNSRSSSRTQTTWRRRQCKQCGSVLTTREYIDLESALRVQSSDALKPFLRDRLFVDVHKSVSHRKSALADARELTDTIITALLALQANGILTTQQITETTHKTLARFDSAASVHYNAHHSPAS